MISNCVLFSRYRHFGAMALFLVSLVGAARPAAAQYDPVAQFSATNNPNGVWTYGFERVPLGSPFTLLPASIPVPSIPGPFVDSWQLPGFGPVAVLHNGTTMTQFVNTSLDNAIYDPGMLAMHPGANDEFALVQFTAPAAGNYSIQGTFEGIDAAWTTSNVYLLLNNTVILGSGTVTGFGAAFEVPLASPSVFLNGGDTLAYAVGGLAFHDTTALIDARVAAAASIPEPSSLLLLCIASVALAAWAWRRQSACAPRPSTSTG